MICKLPSVFVVNGCILIYQLITNKIYSFMPRMGALEKEETNSLILACRARGYHKQILSVVNDNLKRYNSTLSEKGLLNIIQKTKYDAQEWLRNLSMGKDAYVDEYRQRIWN
jgi:hypothetical protein